MTDTRPPAPSMFGRDLTDQVRADTQGSDRMVPVIVEKCIEAVEASGMFSLVTQLSKETDLSLQPWSTKASIVRPAA